MKALKKINDGFIRVSEYIAFVISAIVCAMIVWWAVKRYLFKGEFYGAEELILAFAFQTYFIGAYVATHQDSHISADLFTSMLKTRKSQDIAKLLRLVISLVAYIMLSKLACDFVAFDLNTHKITVMYRFPQVWIHMILPISFILSCLYTVAHIVKTVMELASGKEEGETALPE